MTFSEELRRAVERLRYPVILNPGVRCDPDEGVPVALTGEADLRKPLAALIEAAAKPMQDAGGVAFCRCCGWHIVRHAPDCALVALVRSINGDQAA